MRKWKADLQLDISLQQTDRELLLVNETNCGAMSELALSSLSDIDAAISKKSAAVTRLDDGSFGECVRCEAQMTESEIDQDASRVHCDSCCSLLNVIERLREQIVSNKQQIVEAVEARTEALHSPSCGDEIDRVQRNQEILRTTSRVTTLESKKVSLNNALSRFNAGEYGFCLVCGDDIPFEKLEKYPDSTSCCECALLEK
ncbi:TraR/DksA C4-type zinc finger protein [Vibrio tubiashii]|uniref:TraR/DksA family transcriptional regulator n=1 Tax=Vibrio tubiashii TaxID=29498 RepID=UPI001EFDFBFE|nr:TraR/DksA C4-type zinc finger protein [Vibrio tubiashii]MCG9576688.1 TraR/DksA C4-type zinc finger protein [Vibrio tubiashii]